MNLNLAHIQSLVTGALAAKERPKRTRHGQHAALYETVKPLLDSGKWTVPAVVTLLEEKGALLPENQSRTQAALNYHWAMDRKARGLGKLRNRAPKLSAP